ncbi:MAG: hypothetical protein ACYC2U_04685 [Candidatus Amoebophilus sp.]
MSSTLLPLRKNPPNAILPYLARWQQNNSYKDLGIVRFLGDLIYLSQKMGYPPLWKDFKPEYGVAPWASKTLAQYFYYEEGMTKEDRCFVFATYREGSKTFWFSYFLPIYEMLVGQYGIYSNGILFPEVDYQVLRAKNGREAQKRLMNVVRFFNRPILKDLFGDIKPTFQQVKDKEGKDSANLLILPNGYTFECSGIEQPSRGLNIDQMRPKKYTFDDVQNKENTKTEDRRKQIDAEVMEESFGGVADNGAMIYIGNKVHAADTLGRLLDENNKVWKKQFHTLTVRKEGGKIYPGIGDLSVEVPEWGKRWTIERVHKLLAFYETQPELGGKRGFLKEYYNRIVSEADYIIRFHDGVYKREHNINWLVFPTEDGTPEYKNVNIYIGNDPAISETKASSDASLAVLAIDSDRKRYLLEIDWGKWDLHDRYFNDVDRPPTLYTAQEDMNKIKRRGSVEQVMRAILKYYADGASVESGSGVLAAFFNDLSELARRIGYKGIIYPCPTGTENKTAKLRQVPLCYFETGLYHLRRNMFDLKADVIAFPDCKKDRLDGIYMAEQLIHIPAKINYNPLGLYDVPKKSMTESESIPHGDYKTSGLTNEYESWITS